MRTPNVNPPAPSTPEANANRFLQQTGAACLAVSLVVLAILWRGYVFSTLWGWFVVPTFGMAPIGVAASVGLAMAFRGLFLPSLEAAPATPVYDVAFFKRTMRILFAAPASALLIGLIVRHWL